MTRKQSAKRQQVLKVLRWSISGVLLILLLWWVDLASLMPALKQARPGMLLLGLAMLIGDRFLATERWKLILHPTTLKIGAGRLLRITFISTFLSNFLPSKLSADALRGYFLHRENGQLALPISSVVLDRVVGFSVLVAAAFIAGMIALAQGLLSGQLFLIILAALGLILAAVFLAISPLFRSLAERLQASKLRALRESGNALTAIRDYPWSPVHLLRVVALYGFVAVYGITNAYVFFVGIHDPIPIGYFFLFMPVVLLITSIPLAAGGLGLQEGGLVILLSAAGVQSGNALLYALIVRAANIFVSLPGALLYARYEPERDVHQLGESRISSQGSAGSL